MEANRISASRPHSNILDRAKAPGYRSGEIPVAWCGNLKLTGCRYLGKHSTCSDRCQPRRVMKQAAAKGDTM
jgi:hypothetical protein